MFEAQQGRSPFKAKLTEHFGEDPGTYPVIGETIATYDLPNVRLALDAYLDKGGREHTLIGFGGHLGYAEMSLSGLVHDIGFGLAIGPVRRTVVGLGRGQSITCASWPRSAPSCTSTTSSAARCSPSRAATR
jgi:hypothetical protein